MKNEIDSIIENTFYRLDSLLHEKIDELKGMDLSYFYNKLAKVLREEYFGGT